MKIRTREATGSVIAAATAGGIIAQQVAGKAVRDALFLSTFHVRSLPFAMAAAAGLSLVAVTSVSRLMARHAPRQVLLVLFGMGGLTLFLEWLALGIAPAAVAIAVYLHVAVFGPVILSAFWSMINEQFDPHAARAAVARVATGGTTGGILGGLAAWRASTLVSLPTTVLLLAGVNAMCMLATFAIPRRHRDIVSVGPAEDPSKERPFALGALVKAPYLRNLALLVAVGAAMSSLLDYVFSAQATAAYGTGPPLLAFLSLFGLGVSVVSFLLQVSLGRVATEKLGVAVNIAVLPGIVILGGGLGLAVPGLISATLLRGAEMVQRNTLFRSAYELLYTPLEEKQKRATKALIDVGFDRLGTVVGSAIAMGALALFTHNQNAVLGAVVLLAGATLPLSRNLHRGYLAALKERLRDGERKVSDAPSQGQRRSGFDEKAQDAMIERIEAARSHHDEPGQVVHLLAQRGALVEDVRALLSEDAPRKRRALANWTAAKLPLVPFGILLLAQEEVHVDARKALRAVAKEVTGQLIDALLDPSSDFVVRRRIPAVLSVCASQRAADGLLLALADERFEVRYACVRALTRVADRGTGIVFSSERIVGAIKGEIQRATTSFGDLDDGSDEEPNPLLDLIARDRVSRTVENLFSLLSLILERDGLRLCFSGLHHEDDQQRGTALEYLQTVLPSELRDDLLPLLSDAGRIPTARAPAVMLVDLTRAAIERAFVRGAPLPENLKRCCEALVNMGAAFARIWTYDAAAQVLVLRASGGLYTHIDGGHARVPLGAFKIGRIAATRTAHLINSVIGDPDVPCQDWAKREKLVAFAGYPLIAHDQLEGVVAIFAKHQLSKDILEALASVADPIARQVAETRAVDTPPQA